MLLLFKLGYLNDNMFAKELFIRFNVHIFHVRLSKYVCACVCMCVKCFGICGCLGILIRRVGWLFRA